MMRLTACLAFMLSSASVAANAARPLSPTEEALRLLKVDPEDAHTVSAIWNGQQTVFVDHPSARDAYGGTDRQIYAVRRSNGRLIAIKVAKVEQDGGDPEVAAIGFANADGDEAKELIVIVEWPQSHYDYGGRFLEVRLFDDAKPGQSALAPMSKLSKHFGLGCECSYRDQRKPQHYKFSTIASVQRELRRLGY